MFTAPGGSKKITLGTGLASSGMSLTAGNTTGSSSVVTGGGGGAGPSATVNPDPLQPPVQVKQNYDDVMNVKMLLKQICLFLDMQPALGSSASASSSSVVSSASSGFASAGFDYFTGRSGHSSNLLFFSGTSRLLIWPPKSLQYVYDTSRTYNSLKLLGQL